MVFFFTSPNVNKEWPKIEERTSGFRCPNVDGDIEDLETSLDLLLRDGGI